MTAAPVDPGSDALVARVIAGDRDAYEALVRRHEPALRQWLAGRCPPGADENEMAQRAFVDAYLGLARYRPGGGFAPWLIGIARNHLRLEYRRLRTAAERAQRFVTAQLATAAEAALDEPDEALELPLLRQCLDELPAHLRDLIDRRYVAGERVEEVAGALGRSVGAIKKHLFLIRRRLLECVQRKRLAGST